MSTAVPTDRPGATATAEPEQKVTPLELFFDLIFVFAFTQVTLLMSENPTWEGLGQGMLVLAAVWWAWGGFAWLTNALHEDDGIARFGLLSAMAAMLIAALAIPQAFGEDPVTFAVAYFAVRVLHIAVYTYGAPEVDARDAMVNLAPGLLFAPALLIVAALFGGTAQVVIFVIALLIDYGTPYVRGVAGFRVSPAHFAERFGLIVIIALGESIVAIGAGLDGDVLTAGVVATGLAGIALAGAQWWAYFDVVSHVAERKLTEARGVERNRLARDSWGVMHGLLIAGIILVALGIKKSIEVYDEPLKTVPAVALFGGVALYYAGHVGFRFRNTHTLYRGRLVALVVAVALIPVGTEVDALVALALTAALTAGVVGYEVIRYAEARREIRHQHAGGS
jgi:low temperature requirement protein LtrA